MTAPPPVHPRRLAYLGTPGFAVGPLRALHEAGFEIPLVVSRPDKRRSRRGHDEASPVKAAALELGLPVTAEVDAVLGCGAEVGIVVAYGRIIKPHVLAEVPMLNLHFSRLPRWRGAAPVERAILAGDQSVGVDLMALEEGLDTGPIYARAETELGTSETAQELRSRLSELGTRLLLQTLTRGIPEPQPQAGSVTYAEKIGSEDLHIDWGAPAETVNRVIRVGGAWTSFRGRRFKIHRALVVAGGTGPGVPDGVTVGCGSGALRLVEVQPEGRSRMEATAWAHGARPGPGDRFGQ